MAHVVVLGAGLGGTIMAYELRDLLGSSHKVSVINKGSTYSFVPSNPWVAVGWRDRKDVTIDLEPVLQEARHRALPAGRQRARRGGQVDRTDGRLDSRLRLPRHRHRPRARLRRDRRLRARAEHAVGVPHRPCDAGQAGLRRAGRKSRPGGDRRGAGRLVLRAGLRIRLHPRKGAARRQGARPRADDLRHLRTLYRPSRARRRRRHARAARKRHARPPHQMDHQCQGRQVRGRQGARRRRSPTTAASPRATSCRSATP